LPQLPSGSPLPELLAFYSRKKEKRRKKREEKEAN